MEPAGSFWFSVSGWAPAFEAGFWPLLPALSAEALAKAGFVPEVLAKAEAFVLPSALGFGLWACGL
jgi:hypothetical protein